MKRLALLALAALAASSAPAMDVEGPAPDRVYQRAEDNSAAIDVALSSVSPLVTRLEAALVAEDGGVRATWSRDLDAGAGDAITFTLDSVPAGGPYELSIRGLTAAGVAADSRTIPGLAVGDLWILAGQSNMEGTGSLVDVEDPDPLVRAFYFRDEWAMAVEPISDAARAVDPVHWKTTAAALRIPDSLRAAASLRNIPPDDLVTRKRPLPPAVRELLSEAGITVEQYLAMVRPTPAELDERDAFVTRGASVAVAFGKQWRETAGVPVGLILAANGGTSMDQWDPALASFGGESLYGSMMRRVEAAGGHVTGVLWYQGEQDTRVLADAEGYLAKTEALVAAIRRDLGDEDLPFIYAQIGRVMRPTSDFPHWNAVQHAQLALESRVENAWMLAAIQGSMSDSIHLDGAALAQLGRQMALVGARATGLRDDVQRGPRLAGAEVASDDRLLLRLRFSDVNEALILRAKRPDLHLRDAKDRRVEVAEYTTDSSDASALLLRLLYPAPDSITIEHGRGLYPVVGIEDELGLALPVFPPTTVVLGAAPTGASH